MPGTLLAAEWQVNEADSFIRFSVAIEGNSSGGEFTKFSANMIFDKQHLEQARIDVLIDLDHIEAAYNDVAENLKKAPWFDVARFPTARFVAGTFRHISGNDYQVTGLLTLRDVTRTETLNFTFTTYDDQQAAMTGHMEISRLDYGVGQGGWRDVTSVAEKVILDVAIGATKGKP